uniref:Uncharacterized protein n=1 Tax=Arundo donax TaxID=35708 RepID=A0A0A9EB26_ARUDO
MPAMIVIGSQERNTIYFRVYLCFPCLIGATPTRQRRAGEV